MRVIVTTIVVIGIDKIRGLLIFNLGAKKVFQIFKL